MGQSTSNKSDEDTFESPAVLTTSYEDVLESVRNFNGGMGLESRLRYFRAWYFIPEIDAVGPSKFIGYKNMTVSKYLKSSLDGKATELNLSKWFHVLTEGPEFNHVSSLVAKITNPKGPPNKLVCYCAKNGWELDHQFQGSGSDLREVGAPANLARPIVDVFWRAFLGLYPEDQDILAARIASLQRTK